MNNLIQSLNQYESEHNKTKNFNNNAKKITATN